MTCRIHWIQNLGFFIKPKQFTEHCSQEGNQDSKQHCILCGPDSTLTQQTGGFRFHSLLLEQKEMRQKEKTKHRLPLLLTVTGLKERGWKSQLHMNLRWFLKFDWVARTVDSTSVQVHLDQTEIRRNSTLSFYHSPSSSSLPKPGFHICTFSLFSTPKISANPQLTSPPFL